MKINNKAKGPLCVCGAFLIQFSLGTMYTFGNMSPYIASYLKFKTDSIHITTGDTVWILAGNFFILGGLMAIGGVIQKKIGSRFTCLIGCFSMSLSVGLTYFTIQKNLWLVILTYGLGFGLGIAIAYSVALTSAMKWYPGRGGMISGIVVGGFGLGAFIFSLIQTKYINPLNIPPKSYDQIFNRTLGVDSSLNTSYLPNIPNVNVTSKDKYFFDDSILDKVPSCFIIMGVSYAIIQLIGVIMLMDYESSNTKPYINPDETTENDKSSNQLLTDFLDTKKEKSTEVNDKKNTSDRPKSKDFTVSEAIKTKVFWLLWSTFFLNGIGIVTISAVFKVFGQQFIKDDQYFATLSAVGGICNCLGRLVWGRLFDRFGYRIVMTALTILMAVTMATFYFISFITGTVVVKVFYFTWGCLLFIALSGSFTILPSGTSQCFGSSNLATIYGFVFTGLALASIVGAFVSSFLLNVIQYRGQFVMASIAAIISIILTQFFRLPIPRDEVKKDLLDDEKI